MIPIVNEAIESLNSSAFFAGVIMICLNIGSRYIDLKLNDSMEDYLRYILTKELLIFAIAWMGTRNIYKALGLTALFVFLADFVLNENSRFCLLPRKFKSMRKTLNIEEDKIISDKQINDALETLEKAKKQKQRMGHMKYLDYYNINKE